MAGATPWVGFNKKVRINSVVYTARRVSVRESAGDLEMSNTEGVGPQGVSGTPQYETRTPGLIVAEVSVTNATFDTQENPFAAPRNVAAGAFLTNVFIYLNGLSGVNWGFTSLLILSVTDESDVPGLMPIGWTAKSNGSYSRPF